MSKTVQKRRERILRSRHANDSTYKIHSLTAALPSLVLPDILVRSSVYDCEKYIRGKIKDLRGNESEGM